MGLDTHAPCATRLHEQFQVMLGAPTWVCLCVCTSVRVCVCVCGGREGLLGTGTN